MRKSDVVRLTAALLLSSEVTMAAPNQTSFTYQGQLKNGGSVVTGTRDFRFTLFDAELGGTVKGSADMLNVPVDNGLFSVELDFGAAAFDNEQRWLELRVCAPAGSCDLGASTPLSPRQEITRTPYAIQTRCIQTDDDCNLGLGTNSPARDLTIKSTDLAIQLERDGLESWAVGLTTNGTNGFTFVNLIDDASRLFLSEDGNVGVGTDAPTAKVHVDNGTDAEPGNDGGFLVLGSIDDLNIALDKDEIMARINGATSTLYLNHDGGDIAMMGTPGSSGNLGVGTSTPVGKVSIKHSNADAIWLERTGRENWSLGLTGSGSTGFQIRNESDGQTRLFLAENGNVGVNTITPTSVLEVAAATGVPSIIITSGGRDLAVPTGEALSLGTWDGATSAEWVRISASGDFGLGTTAPSARLHVVDSVSGGGNGIANHVMLVENAAGGDADGVAIKINVAEPLESNNFVTFLDGAGTCRGKIQGETGAAGVNYSTTACDYAEWMEKKYSDAVLEAGDIVGIADAKVDRSTQDGHMVAVISTAPAVLGNMPKEGKEDLFAMVAFLGQVPVKVAGPVRAGDFIVPSGADDGYGRAVSPHAITLAETSSIIGQAWESSVDPGRKKVRCMVGLNPGLGAARRIFGRFETDRARIDELESRLAQLELLITNVDHKDGGR